MPFCLSRKFAFTLVLAGLSGFFSDCSRADETRKWPLELKAGRFEIHCDFELTAQDALLHELKSVEQDLHTLLDVPFQNSPIHVVLFATEDEYKRYMKAYFPKLPTRRAIFLQDRGPGMLFTHWHAQVATDLRHEITHAILNRNNRSLPLWLDEGIAEYFELRPGERFEKSSYLAAVSELSRVRRLPSIRTLAKKAEVGEFDDNDYQNSWAWIHFLIHRNQETRSLLIRYLRDFHTSSPNFDFERALRDVCPKLEDEIEQHFSSIAVNVTDKAQQVQLQKTAGQ